MEATQSREDYDRLKRRLRRKIEQQESLREEIAALTEQVEDLRTSLGIKKYLTPSAEFLEDASAYSAAILKNLQPVMDQITKQQEQMRRIAERMLGTP